MEGLQNAAMEVNYIPGLAEYLTAIVPGLNLPSSSAPPSGHGHGHGPPYFQNAGGSAMPRATFPQAVPVTISAPQVSQAQTAASKITDPWAPPPPPPHASGALPPQGTHTQANPQPSLPTGASQNVTWAAVAQLLQQQRAAMPPAASQAPPQPQRPAFTPGQAVAQGSVPLAAARAAMPKLDRGSGQKHRLRQCGNCGAINTPFWRKDRQTGIPLCNACGLYAAKNDHHRPVKLWREGHLEVQGAAAPFAPAQTQLQAQLPVQSQAERFPPAVDTTSTAALQEFAGGDGSQGGHPPGGSVPLPMAYLGQAAAPLVLTSQPLGGPSAGQPAVEGAAPDPEAQAMSLIGDDIAMQDPEQGPVQETMPSSNPSGPGPPAGAMQ